MKNKRRLQILLFLLAFGVFSYSGYRLYEYWNEGQKSHAANEKLIGKAVETVRKPELTEEKDEPQIECAPLSVDFNVLQKENPDIIAWIYCEDTPVNYPVVQADDNDYYLRRLLDGTWNVAGTLFMDYRNADDFSDWHTVIYGHNMKNDSMFGTLPEYRSQEYYEQHPVWYLLTPTQNYKIELCAGYVTPSDSEVYDLENSKEKRDRILETALEQSCFQANVSVSDEDKLITLSTCSYEFENARFVLTGRLLPIK